MGKHGVQEELGGWTRFVRVMQDDWYFGPGIEHNVGDGSVFAGRWERDGSKEGVISCLNEDGTRSLYNQAYDSKFALVRTSGAF